MSLQYFYQLCTIQRWNRHRRIHIYLMCSLFFQTKIVVAYKSWKIIERNDCPHEKGYLMCNLPIYPLHSTHLLFLLNCILKRMSLSEIPGWYSFKTRDRDRYEFLISLFILIQCMLKYHVFCVYSKLAKAMINCL